MASDVEHCMSHEPPTSSIPALADVASLSQPSCPRPHLGIHSTTAPLPMALPSAWMDKVLIPGTHWPPSTRLMRPPTPPGRYHDRGEVRGMTNIFRRQKGTNSWTSIKFPYPSVGTQMVGLRVDLAQIQGGSSKVPSRSRADLGRSPPDPGRI